MRRKSEQKSLTGWLAGEQKYPKHTPAKAPRQGALKAF